MKAESLFTESDKAALAEAVKTAEQATSGEIVPYIVDTSDDYPEAGWRAGALLGFLVLCIGGVLDLGSDIWLPFGIAEVCLAAIMMFGLGMLVVSIVPSLKRFFVHPSVLQMRVDERAALAFLSEEVFKTRERTGILLFVSLLEHRVRIMGDSGINEKVEQHEWDTIANDIVKGMKTGQPASGLLHAIKDSGALLEKRGVAIRKDDTDELDNTLRMSER